ncbi:phosphoribosylanthranilate isomerase [Sporosarcina sp. BI001-red]|uniref:phosphoribosylanthranilate isomerase n=1 Tax=Sporosarcina sp. BI001-red TaxID=2282866 RepID=UPI000E289A7A|nr:phosphoribosylanthranilate isomerase [Sporosarcina sp. BI001-red]REB07989.1 phosphoribosylanthranilate isomerase [Sporosarcina sp. BI001-red]
MTKVKICGLTEAVHVQAAVEEGADAIGFVFAPSRRQVSVGKAAELASQIPQSVLKVGVFVNATMSEIQAIFEAVPLDIVQYHGDETPEFIAHVGLPAFKAFSIKNSEDIHRAGVYPVTPLFDAPGIEFKGGSGKTFNWDILKETGVQERPFILAGGLNAENVSEAILRVNPIMVDVSSGVEIEKRKDEQLIREFIKMVKRKK